MSAQVIALVVVLWCLAPLPLAVVVGRSLRDPADITAHETASTLASPDRLSA